MVLGGTAHGFTSRTLVFLVLHQPGLPALVSGLRKANDRHLSPWHLWVRDTDVLTAALPVQVGNSRSWDISPTTGPKGEEHGVTTAFCLGTRAQRRPVLATSPSLTVHSVFTSIKQATDQGLWLWD